MLAAGDTFRAAAIEQLQIWGERSRRRRRLPASRAPTPPASPSKRCDQRPRPKAPTCCSSTPPAACRTSEELMAELEKIVRVIKKIDAQRAARDAAGARRHRRPERAVPGRSLPRNRRHHRARHDQARRHRAGGILVAIAGKFGLPVHFIGVGEAVDDLTPFSAHDFAHGDRGHRSEPLDPASSKHLNAMSKTTRHRGRTASAAQDSRSISGRCSCSSSSMPSGGIFPATGAFMAATIVSLALQLRLIRKHSDDAARLRRASCWCSAGSRSGCRTRPSSR